MKIYYESVKIIQILAGFKYLYIYRCWKRCSAQQHEKEKNNNLKVKISIHIKANTYIQIPLTLYLIFFIICPLIENNEAQCVDEGNDDKTDEEPNIKDVMKEAKAASGVLKIKIQN